MNSISSRPRLFISHGPKKKTFLEPDPNLGNLSPDVQADSVPFLSRKDVKKDDVLKLGKYVLFRQQDKLDSYLAIDTTTQDELTCKVSDIFFDNFFFFFFFSLLCLSCAVPYLGFI